MRQAVAMLLILLCISPVAVLADDAIPPGGGPLLEGDDLSPERRAEMEAELSFIRAELAGDGLDFEVGETSFLRLSREERDKRLIQQPWPEPVRGREAGYVFGGYDRDGFELDWRDNDGDFVTGIRNQGGCGSCWDFAATAALESVFLIAIGGGAVPDFDLSEQHVLSCMDDYGLSGDCGGGYGQDVFWFARNVGMLEEFCLPYEGDDTLPCGEYCDDDEGRWYSFGDYDDVCYGADVEAIKDALHNHGPLYTTMVVYDTFEGYSGGVYEASGYVTGYHAVTIIGYNETYEYFIAKNSWGMGWGLGGFFYIAFDSGCGFGDWTAYTSFDATGMGPFAAMRVMDRRPKTGEPVRFYDRSVPVSGEIVSWEWDFNGDGLIDANGSGPHDYVFLDPGPASPWLCVTDIDGQEDICDMTGWLNVVFDGPLWTIDAENGSDYGDGSPGNPLKRIQMGMNIAADGDTVLVKAGTYEGIMNTELKAYGKSFLLLGEGELGDVIVSGSGSQRLLLLDEGETAGCEIKNLVFTDGYDEMRGGIALIEGGSPTILGCLFQNGEVGPDPAARGGAVWSDGSPHFSDCRFQGNTSSGAGGALHSEAGSLDLEDCVLQDNQAQNGAALNAETGSLILSRSSFLGNVAQSTGGAIWAAALDIHIDACLFTGNQVAGVESQNAGGALLLDNPAALLRLQNSILSENLAAMGGALYLGGSSAHLEHVSFWNNQASMAGGALVGYSSELQVRNSIFWSDDALDYPEILAPNIGAEAVSHCLVQGGFTGVNIIDADPLFVDPVAGDFTLEDISPCLGLGLGEGVPPGDYFGQPRPQPESSLPDLGACESPEGGAVGMKDQQPEGMRFTGIYPNPFNPSTTFSFQLAEEAEVRLLVYLPTGRLVDTPLDERLGAGQHRVNWTAIDAEGNTLASGLFLVRLECRYGDGRLETEYQKAILVK